MTTEYNQVLKHSLSNNVERFLMTKIVECIDGLGIYLHGLATLFAEQMCDYSIEQVGELMTELGKSLLARIKQYN